MNILGKITETIAEPNKTVKPKAPKIIKFEIPKDFIGAVIGPGGKNIHRGRGHIEEPGRNHAQVG